MFKPPRVFLLVSIIWGSLTVFLTPPFQVPDEPAHYFRAYQIATGRLLPVTIDNKVGGYIASSMIKFLEIYNMVPFHPEQKINNEMISKSLDIRLNPDQTSFAFSQTPLPMPRFYIFLNP